MPDGICAVVGMGPGIGMAVARRFGAEGYRIALMARRSDKLDDYKQQLAEDGITASTYQLDAANYDQIRQVMIDVVEDMGFIEVLIYNAANYNPGRPTSVTPESVTRAFRVTVGGALTSAQAVIPEMRVRRMGTVIFTGGGLALYPSVEYASLAIGKASIRSLAYTLGDELSKDGIQAGTVTIAGSVQAGTHFDPMLIADSYWQLHTTSRDKREIIYD